MASPTASPSPPSPWQTWQRETLALLADLRFAILLLLLIALASISGTVIEQGEPPAFYQANYPERPALFGFLTGSLILRLGFDHVYHTWWFLALLILLGLSLSLCTLRRQWPALKAARNWRYYTRPQQFQKLALSAELPTRDLATVETLLRHKGYALHRADHTLYARKGILGRVGPILVHASLLTILAGAILGAMTGFIAQEMVPSGERFTIQNILQAGPWAHTPADLTFQVNCFWIDYTPKGDIDQFYSDITVLSSQETPLDRQTIHVNLPLRFRGLTLYQTDWGISAVRVQLNNSPIFELPVRPVTLSAGRFWGAWLPTRPDLSQGITLLLRDLQGQAFLYNPQGQFLGAVRLGETLPIEGLNLHLIDILGSTGLQIKSDPGVPLVYTGFALLMVGVALSYLSHSQIWALQDDDHLYLGGRTNRAQLTFEREFLDLLNQIPTQSG